mmetsp:Transcript_78736/g.236029  ORF Transcript_78736/g.236029 Transcript_78736/m.236029 type:complete len:330 (+) Transcript_78736:803-1792(+)
MEALDDGFRRADGRLPIGERVLELARDRFGQQQRRVLGQEPLGGVGEVEVPYQLEVDGEALALQLVQRAEARVRLRGGEGISEVGEARVHVLQLLVDEAELLEVVDALHVLRRRAALQRGRECARALERGGLLEGGGGDGRVATRGLAHFALVRRAGRRHGGHRLGLQHAPRRGAGVDCGGGEGRLRSEARVLLDDGRVPAHVLSPLAERGEARRVVRAAHLVGVEAAACQLADRFAHRDRGLGRAGGSLVQLGQQLDGLKRCERLLESAAAAAPVLSGGRLRLVDTDESVDLPVLVKVDCPRVGAPIAVGVDRDGRHVPQQPHLLLAR